MRGTYRSSGGLGSIGSPPYGRSTAERRNNSYFYASEGGDMGASGAHRPPSPTQGHSLTSYVRDLRLTDTQATPPSPNIEERPKKRQSLVSQFQQFLGGGRRKSKRASAVSNGTGTGTPSEPKSAKSTPGGHYGNQELPNQSIGSPHSAHGGDEPDQARSVEVDLDSLLARRHGLLRSTAFCVGRIT